MIKNFANLEWKKGVYNMVKFSIKKRKEKKAYEKYQT